MKRFPSLAALAAADEHDVLAEWSGLATTDGPATSTPPPARSPSRHDAAVPADPETLIDLRGSAATRPGPSPRSPSTERCPPSTATLSRVILRLEARDLPLASPATLKFVSDRAAALLATPEAPPTPARSTRPWIELGRDRLHAQVTALPGLPGPRALPGPRPRLAAQDPPPQARRTPDGTAGRLRRAPRRRRGASWSSSAPTRASGPACGRHPPSKPSRPGEPRAKPAPPPPAAHGRAPARAPADDFMHATTHRLVRFRVWHARLVRAPRSATARTRPADDSSRRGGNLPTTSPVWRSRTRKARILLGMEHSHR